MSDPPARRASDYPPRSMWGQVWENLPQIVALSGGAVVIIGIATWAVGSIKPQSQVDIDNLKTEYAALAARVAANEIKLAALPRPDDFTDWKVHLSRLDGRADEQKDKTTQMQYDVKDLTSKYQALTVTGTRK